jgi:hypothetical protein
MGQYQQWLHHREIEQQLQMTQATLEQELSALQERVSTLEQIYHYAENPIIEALAASLSEQNQEVPFVGESNGASLMYASMPALETAVPPEESAKMNAETGNGSHGHGEHEVLSSALLAWGNLPNFDALPVPQQPEPESLTTTAAVNQPLPSIPHSELDLLPDDLVGFFDSQHLTEPQLELPWWLRNITPSTYTSPANGPVDQESIRTNRLVQRWLERWGRQTQMQTQSSQQTPLPQNEPGEGPV